MGIFAEIAAGLSWYVAHTRPRCEKKLAHYCSREGFPAVVPCVERVAQHGRKTITFEKPLFSGYVFFRSEPERIRKVYQSDYTANVLTVFDQALFEQQLRDILLALESGCFVLGPLDLDVGKEVRILAGPLAGMSGRVVNVSNKAAVVLRLDFLGQGAAVVVDSADLEIIG